MEAQPRWRGIEIDEKDNAVMNVIRAQSMGMCFGVRDAIARAREVAREGPLTILGELVHNRTVLEELQGAGIRIAREVSEIQTPQVMITAHGVSDQRLKALRSLGKEVHQATCPLVQVAHRAVKGLAAEGYHPVIIGQAGHVEVRGLTEDLVEFDVVLTELEVEALAERPRFGVAAQTTQPLPRVESLVDLLRGRFPKSEIRFIDTVCHPTKQRQLAAVELASHCDCVIVIGGVASNNTRELAATCRQFCPRVFHIETENDLRPEWVNGATNVGITAGTSTPDSVIEAVEKRLESWKSSHEQKRKEPVYELG